MNPARTVVQILNNDLDVVTEIKNLYPINQQGMILRYSKELSDYGECLFRVSTKDPFLTQFGDILEPHKYHIRIKQAETIVWSGAIIDNPIRNKNYIEVKGAEYDFYLDRVFIRRDAEVTAGDGKDNYRTFKTGTMASAVQTLINNAITDFGPAHPMSNLTINTIDNPDYPQGFTDANGIALTGGWNFTDFITLQFDYHSAYYVLKAFGLYANADFEINQNLEFTFKPFIGNKETGITFRYGTQGNIVDYNSPRLGKRMINDLWGIAADNEGKILHVEQKDTVSVQQYGLLQGANAFADVKDQNMLKTRVNESLKFLGRPDTTPVNITLNEKGYPLGQYDIGDIVTVEIKDHIIDFRAPRRIVGITVNVHNTGREMVTVQTNAPNPRDVGE